MLLLALKLEMNRVCLLLFFLCFFFIAIYSAKSFTWQDAKNFVHFNISRVVGRNVFEIILNYLVFCSCIWNEFKMPTIYFFFIFDFLLLLLLSLASSKKWRSSRKLSFWDKGLKRVFCFSSGLQKRVRSTSSEFN